jgi:sulfatase-like protein
MVRKGRIETGPREDRSVAGSQHGKATNLRRLGISGSFVTAAKIAAIAAAVYSVPWDYTRSRLDYFLRMDRYPQAVIFLTLTALCLVAFVLLPFVKSSLVRIPIAVLAVGGFAADQLAWALSNQNLDTVMIGTLWREHAMIGTASSAHFWPGLRVISWILPIMLAFVWRPAKPVVLRTYWAAIPVLAFIACVVVVRLTTFSGTMGLPAAFRVPAVTIMTIFADHYSGPRDEVAEGPTSEGKYSKIVMIVDESVRGDFLAINDPTLKNTPFLSGTNDTLVNFGLAVAAHNCSAPARLILRAGLQPADLPDVKERALKAPAIWQFAKKAGYETVLIDAFAEVFATHSFMSKHERAFIDKEMPVSTMPIYMRDMTIARERLPPLLATNQRMFIYVNKYGAHFPYRQTHPPNFLADGADLTDNLDNRKDLVASYLLALRWTVDEFFRALLQLADLKDTLIIYTSDHGQSMLDGGYKLTHCSSTNVNPGEGVVPIFAITDDREFGRLLKTTASLHFGKTTHFDIFPTLLLAMGYSEPWVAQRYSRDSLVHLTGTAPRQFLTGDIFGTGLGAKWVDVK